MNEEWRDIQNYEGLYQVSNLGRVKSFKDDNGKLIEKILKQQNHKQGYLQVCLCKEGNSKHFLVHRLVAKAFLDNPNNLPQVNHIDENKKNNLVDNLEWCDAKYNNTYGTFQSRRVANTDWESVGIKNAEKLTNGVLSKPVYQYDKQCNLIKIWKSTMECDRNGFNSSAISACCNGKRNSHKGFVWSYTPIEPIS